MSDPDRRASNLPTNAREALASRAQTLGTLTAVGAIRGGGPELTGSLHAGWLAERRLIERILADTLTEQSVFATLDHWEDRTRAFQQKAGMPDAGWTDKQGEPWRADQVLGLILDLRDRLSAWQEKASPATAAAPGPATQVPIESDGSSVQPAPTVP
ncbi:MAG TPA: hypothetical protein PK826_14840 [Anaerolineae bacterium]|nr:hypothetical protein [Anaerolineae bacterium]